MSRAAEKTTKLDKKGIAKALYLNGEYTQEEIAEKVGVTRKTVNTWIKADNWEELKANLTITTTAIIGQFNRQIAEINKTILAREDGKRFPTPAEADSLLKIANAIKKLENEAGIAETIGVAMKFLAWMQPIAPQEALIFNKLFDTYIKDITSRKK